MTWTRCLQPSDSTISSQLRCATIHVTGLVFSALWNGLNIIQHIYLTGPLLCLLKSLGFCLFERLVLCPRLEEGRRRGRHDHSERNQCTKHVVQKNSSVFVRSLAGEPSQTQMSCTLKWNDWLWTCDLLLLPSFPLLSPSTIPLNSFSAACHAHP